MAATFGQTLNMITTLAHQSLKEYGKNIPKVFDENPPGLNLLSSDRKSEFMHWLLTDDNASTATHDRLCSLRDPNSGRWFLQSPEYLEWADGLVPGLLFCVGNGVHSLRSKID